MDTRSAVTVLTEQQIEDEIALLDNAWKSDEFFVVLPEKLEVPLTWIQAGIASLPAELREGGFALLTSGSTGKPKLVFGRRDRSEKMAGVLHELQSSEPVAETIVTLPLSYCYAFVNQWLWARARRRRLVMTHGFRRPDELLEALSSAQDAMLCAVGAQMALFKRYFAGRSFPGVIRLHFAGGPFPAQDIEVVRELFPKAVVYNNFGCAEAMPRLTLRPWAEGGDAADVGRPLPGVELRADEQGRILFRSPYGAAAFYDDAGLTVIAAEHWVPSGDLGEPLPSGGWRLTGRASEVFKRYGEKISLPRLLSTVRQAWKQQAAFYRTKDASGEDGCVLVLAPGPDEAGLSSVLQAFRKNHPRAHWPIRVESVDALPLLGNGKVDAVRLVSIPGKTVRWEQKIEP